MILSLFSVKSELMHTYVECCLLINELYCSMVHGKWSNSTHSYYTQKIAFVKSYDAFFLLFFHKHCRSSIILFLFCSPNAAWLHFIRAKTKDDH